jgi:hypothetical protein
VQRDERRGPQGSPVENLNAWYLIEQDNLHHVLPHHKFTQLVPDTFVLHQVFDTHREALHEMSRLIELEIKDVHAEVSKISPRK